MTDPKHEVPAMAQLDLLADELLEVASKIRETVALLRAEDTRGTDVDER